MDTALIKVEDPSLASVIDHQNDMELDSHALTFTTVASFKSELTDVCSPPASPVFLSQASIITDDEDAEMLSLANHVSFERDSNSPKTIIDAPHFLTPLTLESQPENLPSTSPSRDPLLCHMTFGLSSDQASAPPVSTTTTSPRGNVLPSPTSGISITPRSPFSFGDNSPKLSSTTSSNNSSPAVQPSFAESYVSLTSWTARLASQGQEHISSPDKESTPISFSDLGNQPIIPASSPQLFTKPNTPPLYSKLGSVSPSDAGDSSSSSAYLSTILNKASKPHTTANKGHRFKKTADALQKSGLWEVAMKTGNLIKRNRELQKELEQFRIDALRFVKSVVKNPQNRVFIKNVLTTALLANNARHKKVSAMNVIVSAAAAAATAAATASSMKSKLSSTTAYDSGISSSSGSECHSDESVSNFSTASMDTECL